MDPTILKSSIVAVTLYADRAQITRRATLPLESGEHTLCFDKLPQSLDPDSIQVSGTGGGLLRDIKCTQQYYTHTPHEKINSLRIELEGVDAKLRETQDHLNRVNKERQFIDNIIVTLTHSGDEPNNYRLEPERWIKMVDFYRERLTALDSEQREQDGIKHQQDLERRRLQQQINNLSHGGNNMQDYRVELSVSTTAATDMTISLQYMVQGPGWYPVYDLRVDSTARQIGINYMAMVQQTTGEDWDNVELQLSTAQVHIGGEQPQLSPWRVSEWVPPPVAAALKPKLERMRSKMAKEDEEGARVDFMEVNADPFAAMAAAAPKPMEIPTANVVTNATAVVFVIPGSKSVKSDNEPHRVTVLMEQFPAEFRYASVPKLAPHAYLKAKVKNTSRYPFLPGETQIFLDNQFVAKGRLEFIAPGEEFTTSLGVDAAMKVEHQLIRRMQKQTGLVNKSVRYEYEYHITLTNNKSNAEDVTVWDQLPVSSHEKIQVQLLEPAYRADSTELKKTELNYLEWNYQLKAGEKRVIPLSFAVEYPVGMRVEGL